MQSSVEMKILSGARPSPLSLAQVREVQQLLSKHRPHITIEPLVIETIGDRDQKTSLRSLEKTDFFTRDIDQSLLRGDCRIAIHSAKDLPEPLPAGLQLAALTEGVDSSDSLVFRPGEHLASLPPGAVIATSSERRESAVLALRPNLSFIDVRGTIHQRLALLDHNRADGVVIAEAALIRLGLTHLPRITLPGETVPLQGRLAILSRQGDEEMEEIFSCMDARQIELNVGLTSSRHQALEIKSLHCPLIKTVPRPLNSPEIQYALEQLAQFTHLIFTSKSAVHYFFDYARDLSDFCKFSYIAVGQATAAVIKQYADVEPLIAEEETAEGVCVLLDRALSEDSFVLWPHSAQARSVIQDYLNNRNIRHCCCPLYETLPDLPQKLPDLQSIDKLVFTSPSTIDAFMLAYGSIPSHISISCIGPVTNSCLKERLQEMNFSS